LHLNLSDLKLTVNFSLSRSLILLLCAQLNYVNHLNDWRQKGAHECRAEAGAIGAEVIRFYSLVDTKKHG